MPKLTIDGKEIEVAPGTRVIEAAKQAGIDVPYYCYHPGLSVAGNCRMCLVDIEKTPKLQIACHVQAAEGMVVKTNTEKVLKTRQHVLEFLLVNHPLDCPVCDQAGECWLQDYYMRHGLHDSRVSEDKNKKPKAVSIGPTVMLDAERCILCSRCVRFCDEISHTSELGIINRGDHGEIAVFPEKELNNPYSGNVVDICPVGALTDKDFRFKMRVWYLKTKDSLCTGCSRGCNIQVQYNLDRPHHTDGDRVMRLKPRFNEHINKWWMCDEGRYGYKHHDHNRISTPRKRENHLVKDLGWDEILPEAAQAISSAKGGLAVLLSPQMTNEELFLARELFSEKMAVKDILLLSPKGEGFQDNFLIQADKNPNTRGAAALGLSQEAKALESLVQRINQGSITSLVIFGQDVYERFEKLGLKADLSKLKQTVFIGANNNLSSESASISLPSATSVEKDGTYTNCDGRVQRFDKILEPLAEARSEIQILKSLAAALGFSLSYAATRDVFHEMSLRVEAFKGLDYDALGDGGSDIRTMAAPTVPQSQQYDNIL
jgi:NADH-quinone oxidoreductase subunit G